MHGRSFVAAASSDDYRNSSPVTLVRATGLGFKWLLVSVLFLALWRIRPRIVWAASCVYVLIVGYHVVGALLLIG
jgi:hypothetical protein